MLCQGVKARAWSTPTHNAVGGQGWCVVKHGQCTHAPHPHPCCHAGCRDCRGARADVWSAGTMLSCGGRTCTSLAHSLWYRYPCSHAAGLTCTSWTKGRPMRMVSATAPANKVTFGESKEESFLRFLGGGKSRFGPESRICPFVVAAPDQHPLTLAACRRKPAMPPGDDAGGALLAAPLLLTRHTVGAVPGDLRNRERA